MSACARCRWGPGTTTERAPNTENAKQLEGGLAAIMAARAAQDACYFPDNTPTPTINQTLQQAAPYKVVNSLRFHN
jgi:hypothetical protein